MKQLKKIALLCLTITSIFCMLPVTNANAATKSKAQINKLCDKKYTKFVDSYAKEHRGIASVGDINKDGINELIVSDYSSASSSEHFSIIVAYNKQTGKFVKTKLEHAFNCIGNGYILCTSAHQSEIYKMDKNGKFKLVALQAGGLNGGGYSRYINNKEVSEETYSKFFKKHITDLDPFKSKRVVEFKRFNY